MYIKIVDGVCDCTVFEAMFNPNDVVLVSKSSLLELPDSAMRLAQTLLISSAKAFLAEKQKEQYPLTFNKD